MHGRAAASWAAGRELGIKVGSTGWSTPNVLSIAKLRVGQEAYQLTGVAQGLDDYYTGDGEAPGTWMGTAAERLGLDGEVAPDDLRAVLAGVAPGSGGLSPDGRTIRPHPRRVPGFDLCFKVPKSLSALYAVSDDPRVQGAIIEAGEAAVRETLGWLEREAIRVRRGNGNERQLADLAVRDPGAAEERRVKVLRSTGVAAAAFRHRTSRAGDPLLHWHVLVPNLVEGPDGRWSAFVHPELYRHVRAAGEVFQAAVRAEVTARLGLEWRPGHHVPEVAGVPQGLCDQFSKRSREVEAWLEAAGLPDDPASRQEAVLATRKGKPEREGERFDVAWKAEAISVGWGPEAAERLLAGLAPAHAAETFAPVWRLSEWTIGPGGDRVARDRLVDPEEWIRVVLEQDLTQPDATFTRPQLAQLVASRLGAGATVTTVERVCERVLASAHVIPVIDEDEPRTARWTSRQHLERERRLLETAEASRDTVAPLQTNAVETALQQRPTIGDDQAEAVRAIAYGTDAISVLIGPAGTGKTFTLDTVRTAYTDAGYQVIGAAPSARAALALTAGASIPSRTLHRLLQDWESNMNLPGAATVLVVDEAGMAATRELEPAVTGVVKAGGRVLLVGDHRQLPAVTASGGFAALATDKEATVATLEVNRRQVEPWERDALRALRLGNAAVAVDAYRNHGRVITTSDRSDMVAAAVERWFRAKAEGLEPVLLAGTNETVDALNTAVRHELVARGRLPFGPALAWGHRDFALGDRVVVRRNSYQEHCLDGTDTALVNGEAGTVIDGGPYGLAVSMDLGSRVVAVRGEFIAAGHLDHAYALTITRAQGGTWDVGIGVGLDGLYREAGYTQLSRGSQSNWLVLTQAELHQIDAELTRHDRGLPLSGEPNGARRGLRSEADGAPFGMQDELRRSLERSRAKALALTRDPHADHVAQLAHAHSLLELTDRARYCRSVEQQATRVVGGDPRVLSDEVARARHTAEHLAVDQLVKVHDRHNIGTVIGFDDSAGKVDVHFISADGQRQATKTFRWSQIEILDRHPEPRALTAQAHAVLDELPEPVREKLQRWHAHLASHGVHADEAVFNERAAQLHIDRAAGHLTYDQPGWLHHLLGAAAPDARSHWGLG